MRGSGCATLPRILERTTGDECGINPTGRTFILPSGLRVFHQSSPFAQRLALVTNISETGQEIAARLFSPGAQLSERVVGAEVVA